MASLAGATGSARGAAARQQAVVVVLGVGLERQRGTAGEGGDELVRGRLVELGLGGDGDLGLRFGRGTRRALLLAFEAGVGDQRAQQPDRPDRVVVGRDDVIDLVGIDVRVAGRDDRDLELVRLGHRDPLAVRVDDEDGARDALHLAHPADRQLELRQLLLQLRGFLLRHPVELARLLARLELLEQADPLLDRREVREHAAEPALVDVRLAGPGRLLGDRLLGLLLRADEQHVFAPGDNVADELQRGFQMLDGLGQIDDVDPVALREDERAHLGIPAARLVAEVDSGFEQLPH